MKSLAIERECGSGGREIGMLVAKLADIPYYDSELLRKAAEKQGVSTQLLESFDEKKIGSFLYDIGAFSDYSNNQQNTVYELFDALRQTIQNIERNGPAVFVGRCSTEILRERQNALRVFIYSADTDKRIARIAKTKRVSDTEAKILMQKTDKERKNYFRFWTQKDWSDSKNYDLKLNTSSLSPEICAKMLLAAMDI